MATGDNPTYNAVIDQTFFVEPNKSSANVKMLIDQGWFPEEIFDTSPDSILSKFFESLMGINGVGSLRKTFYESRLVLEANHLQNEQLEKFYTNPLKFSKNITSTPFYENYTEDPFGVLTKQQWDTLRAKDESYRNRVLDFLHAARLGGTVEGLKLAAKSAAGYEVDLIENYQYMFDQHSDDVIGLESYRSNQSFRNYDANEFTFVPNQEISRIIYKKVNFKILNPVDSGSIVISFNGEEATVLLNSTSKTITALDLYTVISNFKSVGSGNVSVKGSLSSGFEIKFFNNYSDRADTSFKIVSKLYTQMDKTNPIEVFITDYQFTNPSDEVSGINQYDRYLINEVIERIKPVNSYGTYSTGESNYQNQIYSKVSSSSAYHEVINYVTGSNSIQWPPVNKTNWIESEIEKVASKTQNASSQHYRCFHSPIKIAAYNDEALNDASYLSNFSTIASNDGYLSEHAGPFNKIFADTFRNVPFLQNVSNSEIKKANLALADFAQPLDVTSRSEEYDTSYVNDLYPITDDLYPIIQNNSTYSGQYKFWASNEKTSGSEYLEVDLGSPKAINFMTAQIFKLPIDIEITYDQIGSGSTRSFQSVIPQSNSLFIKSLYFNPSEKSIPWNYLTYNFTDKYGNIPFARYIRIKFTRRSDFFLSKKTDGSFNPWPVLVKNLRIGRNV
jgi:hypothetical protein